MSTQSLRTTLVNLKEILASTQEGYLISQYGGENNKHISTFDPDTPAVWLDDMIIYLQFAYNAGKMLELVNEWLENIDYIDYHHEVGLQTLQEKILYTISVEHIGEDDATE